MAITKIGTPELFDFSATNTALQLPTGDTASRPTSPSTGEWRFNSELKYVEYYDGADWFQIDTEANAPVGSENFNVNTYFGNGATQAIDAKFNEAANFDGSSSLISLPTGVDRNNDFTLSFWVNFNTLTDYDSLITLQLNYRIYTNAMSDGRLFFYDGNTTLSTSTGAVATGNWYNIVVTKSSTLVNGKGMIIYVNGVDVANNNEITNAPNNTSTGLNLLGAYNASPGGNYFYLDGKLDQVRIFNTALTAAQAEDLYTDETTTTASTLNFPVGAGCIAAYQLDGNGDDISTNYNGTTTDIGYTGLKFTPDFTWIKRRDGTENHYLQDSVRGSTQQIYSNLPNGQFNETTAVTSFSANGFNMGSYNGINNSGETYVAWSWKAGGAAVQNTDGTNIISQVSANVDAGFSIVSYTGTGSTATVGHGLNQPVELILVKNTSASASWAVYSAPTGINKFLELNSSGAATSYSNYWGAATPTNDVFGVVNGNFNNNATNASLIAYCFHSVAGYSKIGSYTGDGNAPGPIETIGFTPRWVMIKSTTAEPWLIFDSARNTSNPRTCHLRANRDIAESCISSESIDFNANDFQIKSTWAALNTLGVEYIYMAFAST